MSHENAAAVARVSQTTHQTGLLEPVERPDNGGLRDVELSRQAADRLRPLLEIADQKDGKLTGCEVAALPADQTDDVYRRIAISRT
jgi:hypothetical protein